MQENVNNPFSVFAGEWPEYWIYGGEMGIIITMLLMPVYHGNGS